MKNKTKGRKEEEFDDESNDESNEEIEQDSTVEQVVSVVPTEKNKRDSQRKHLVNRLNKEIQEINL